MIVIALFAIRAQGSNDPWEKLAGGCEPLLTAHLDGRQSVDLARFKGSAAAARFRKALGKSNGLVVALCHGVPDALLIGDRRILDVSHVDELSAKFCYFMACHTAECLGPQAMKAHAVGFVGFKGKLVFYPWHRVAEQQEAFASGAVAYLQAPKAASVIADVLRQALRQIVVAVRQGATGRGLNLLEIGVIGALSDSINAVRSSPP